MKTKNIILADLSDSENKIVSFFISKRLDFGASVNRFR